MSERRRWCQKGGVGVRKEFRTELLSEKDLLSERSCCQTGEEELSDRRGCCRSVVEVFVRNAERSLSESRKGVVVRKDLLPERSCCQKGVVARKGDVVRQEFVVEELLSVQLSVCCQKCRKELMRKEFVGKEL